MMRSPPARPEGAAPAAEFADVSKAYAAGSVRVDALRQVSCHVPRGEMSYVFGPSGSGKTTFLNILGVVDRPDQGKAEVLGVDVSTLSDAAAADFRARHVGYVFQSFNLIPVLSARENVEYILLRRGLPRAERRERACHYLAAVGLDRDGIMDRRPGELSGGQRQRVAVARALAGEPDIVVADEPTANLDSRTSGEIIELMCQMQAAHATTFVICTHDVNLISSHVNLLQIVDGQIQHTEKLS